jgi:signal transduction histidine kinase
MCGLCLGTGTAGYEKKTCNPVSACHELRNPLHAIMATLEFLVEDTSTLTTEQHSDILAIHMSASHMQRLVNDVLDLAKLREGSLQIRPESVVNAVVYVSFLPPLTF